MGYTPPMLYVNKITGGWSLSPPDNTTTDDLTITANSVDVNPYIQLLGASYIILSGASAGIHFAKSGAEFLSLVYTSPDIIFTGLIADKNISLVPAGTGLVKFGAYTAGAATDSTGYITILDAAGNTRKLMVQA